MSLFVATRGDFFNVLLCRFVAGRYRLLLRHRSGTASDAGAVALFRPAGGSTRPSDGDPQKEGRTLFTRVAFSIAIANVDDHLRNWAFLREGGKWLFSPVFDVNPCPYANSQRVTAIAGEMREREALGLKDLAAYVGLDFAEAARIVGSVLAAIKSWESVARKNGCSEREIKLFQPVFSQKASELRKVFLG